MLVEPEWLAVAGGAALSLIIYFESRRQQKQAQHVKDAEVISCIEQVKEGECISYGCVSGVVQPDSYKLRSLFTGEEGVIRHVTFTEHCTKMVRGFWVNENRRIKNEYDSVPFSLLNQCPPEQGGPWTVTVGDPRQSQQLYDDLPVIYNKFVPKQTDIWQAGIERLAGDVTKGYTEMERLLPIGTKLLAFGKITKENNILHLDVPDSGQVYILTTKSKSQIIRSLESNVGFYVSALFGLVTAGTLLYIGYKQYLLWRQQKAEKVLRDEIWQSRVNRAAEEVNAMGECVVCVNRARNVILLNCGHVCVCYECAMALGRRGNCPMCRQPVDRVAAVYLS